MATRGALFRKTDFGFTGHRHGSPAQIVAGHQPVEHYLGRALSPREARMWRKHGVLLLVEAA